MQIAEATSTTISLSPVGIVESDVYPSRIRILDYCAEALDGLSIGDNLWVLYWMHRLDPDDRTLLRVHARGDISRPKRGVFAVRTQLRPNPIGPTKVALVRVESTMLWVEGLGAKPGSPVLDFQP
ncbi:MAG: tRNA (N6-threonylcarbamoyladenosine(37)-N6)-methyltransferase TrmO [Armatimonadetes bacterium CG_4_9_14_3_um_filter_58_7]|nr:MAG: tRNA (N6-threonylcarbamoyladenosine(37)-N6)-methyltransferase TrmO [Armatimonadetes bacterium CG_4_9_14_3_um_filter_58_7]